MIAITEATRRVHITRRSIQQTLIEGEIGVQWPGVDSDSVSLLVMSDMTSSQPSVGYFGVASMVVESTHTEDSREKSVELHGIIASTKSSQCRAD